MGEIAEVLSGARQWCVVTGDCLDVLPTIERVDAIVTDPPYGIADVASQTSGRTRKRSGAVNDWHPPSEWDAAIDPGWAAACARVAGVVAWFGHWRKRFEVESAMGMPLRCEIVWAKDTHVGPPCPAAMRDERIWIFGREGIRPQHFETTVWDEPIIPTWARREHKNEKPAALMQRLAAWLTAPADVILDPFCGSGTTGVAALCLGRRFIGIDKEERWAALSRERLTAEERGSTLQAQRAGQEVLFRG